MIGYVLATKSGFLPSARYVFNTISKMMGLPMVELSATQLQSKECRLALVYGNEPGLSIPESIPFLHIAHVDYDTQKGIVFSGPEIISTGVLKNAPDRNIALFSSDLPALSTRLYNYDDQKPAITLSNRKIHCRVDIIATCFYFLTLENERRTGERDQFGRFHHDYNPVNVELYDYPVVDRYVTLIRTLIELLCPDCIKRRQSRWPQEHSFCVALSHDVDRIRTFTLRKVRRQLKPALAPPGRLAKTICNLGFGVLNWQNWSGNFNHITQLERRFNANSTFFFVAKRRHKLDPNYKLTSRRLLRGKERIQHAECAIGLHGSIPAARNQEFLSEERAVLENWSGHDVVGCRQHYLTFNEDITWLAQQAAHFCYDSTVGFSSYTGYRCGTSFPFQPFDATTGKILDILEIPLILMDTVLFLESKQHMSADNAWPAIQKILNETLRHGSCLTVNWHNSDLYENDFSGFSELYEKILAWTAEHNGWLCSPDDVYEWWSGR